MFRTMALCLAALALVAGLTACDDDPTAPGIEPEIVNTPGSFEFQVTRVSNYSGTLEYTWSNAEVSANLDQSISLSQGSVQLTVLDAADASMYDAAIADGSLATAEGQAGDWTVRVRFERATGTLNFRLQPRTP